MRLCTEMQKFPGRKGTWYLIDTAFVRGEQWFLYESELYGNDAAWLVVNARTGKVFMKPTIHLNSQSMKHLIWRKKMQTKAERDRDTAEMINAINRNADRASRRAYEEILLAIENEKKNQKRYGIACITLGCVAFLSIYAAMCWNSERLLAAYGG